MRVRSLGLKGVGAKIVCLEEASRLDQAVFQEVIVPLLGVKDTAVLGISTPLDDTNFYSQMTEMKQEDGKTPLFNVITISLICEECAGKDLQGQITCPHKQNEIPPWKTQRRQDLVKKLLESNPEMYKREQLGVITGGENCAFPAHRISRFEASAEECTEHVSTIFCCIDPAGGGSSCAAILSGFMYASRTKAMVIACDQMQTMDDKEQETLIKRHLMKVRSNERFRHAQIITVIEANLAWVTASTIARVASAFTPIAHLSGDFRKETRRVGVWMTNDIKEGMRREMFTLLDTDRISFDKDFHSESNGMKGVVGTQLRNYKFEVKPPKDAFAKPKLVLSGKGYGTNDDMCIVLQMLPFWANTYYNFPDRIKHMDPVEEEPLWQDHSQAD